MNDTPSTSGKPHVGLLPIKKNPKGKIVSLQQKKVIINLYKSKISNQPNFKLKELVKMISVETGLGNCTVQSTICNYKNKGIVKLPNLTKCRHSIKEKTDHFEKNAIRRKIHAFWCNYEVPTLDKIVMAINEDPNLNTYKRSNLYRLLKDLGFVYSVRGRNSGLIESDNIVIWRNRYIEKIRKYRLEGRTIYYLGETWINTDDSTKKLIIIHIGSEGGFVQGGKLTFETKTKSLNYFDEMNYDIFFDWMKTVIPLLDDNCVIVMDNSRYHNEKVESCPTISWKKEDIQKWLEEKDKCISQPTIKPRLMEIVNCIKSPYDKYVIDEYVNAYNKIVLRLPPYHGELNAIEFAWLSVKNYIKTNRTISANFEELLHDAVESCTPEKWKDFVHNAQKEEERLWQIDFTVDYVMENVNPTVLTISDDTSESDGSTTV